MKKYNVQLTIKENTRLTISLNTKALSFNNCVNKLKKKYKDQLKSKELIITQIKYLGDLPKVKNCTFIDELI